MENQKNYSYVALTKISEGVAFGHIEGRITKEIEMKDHQGKAIASTSLVVDNATKKLAYALGVEIPEQESFFLDVAGWEKVAERMGKAIKKGDVVGITGRVKSREYNGKVYLTLTVDDFKRVYRKEA